MSARYRSTRPAAPSATARAGHTLPPRQLDVLAFAREAGRLHGTDTLANHPRLLEDPPDADAQQQLHWQAEGAWRVPPGGAGSAWLHLVLSARVPQTCQRCLLPVSEPVEVDRWFRFVADEAAAEHEDEGSEEDLLVAHPRFDLNALIEDELLLALPMVPMHGSCPVAVKTEAVDEAFARAAEPTAHPFAGLAGLKKPDERP